jgi:hypothetical protein
MSRRSVAYRTAARAPEGSHGKVRPGAHYLAGRSGSKVMMTFSDIERLVGRLPASARDYRA